MKESIFQNRLNESLDKFKENTALECGERTMTYAQLERQSNLFARRIIEKGIKEQTFIGILTEDRMTLICAMTGILKARCVFVPLDPAYPAERLAAMISGTHLEFVFSDAGEAAGRIPVEAVEFIPISAGEDAVERPDLAYSGADRVYVYFTSGSTGTPRAIVGKNSSLLHFIEWEIETFAVDETSRFSQFTNIGFDALLRDVFVPLFSGGTVCIPPGKELLKDLEKLEEWIDGSRISVIHCVPAFFRTLTSDVAGTADTSGSDRFKDLKFILLSGERIYPSDLVPWYKTFGERIQLVNFYGPTETTMIKAFYPIREADTQLERIPVGKPMKGARVVIWDKAMNLCKQNMVGQFYIRTPHRTYGYYNDPQLNSERFIKNPYNEDPDDLLYATGDLGRLMPDGNLDLLGRNDRQVKIRGVRIEPEEIETVLMSHPGVKEAAVIKERGSNQNERLRAFITGVGEGACDGGDVTAYIAGRLSEYMMPANLVVIDQMPRNPNGKINYEVLHELLEKEETDLTPPASDFEERLLHLWREILGKEDIGVNSNFLDLGGNSLNVMTLVARIHREFDIRIPLGEIFNNATIRKQAGFIMTAEADNPETFAPIEPVDKKEYYVLSSAQKRLYFLQQMDPEGTGYNMPQTMPLRLDKQEPVKQRLEETFKKLIHRHEVLRTSFHLIDGEPFQKIQNNVDFEIEYHELPTDDTESTDDTNESLLGVRPFDLSRAPLMRAVMVNVQETQYVLMVDMHHIISDEISNNILSGDFKALLEGKELSPLRLQYKDYAHWQNSGTGTESIKKQETYWLQQFDDPLPVLNLAADFPRPVVRSIEGDNVDFHFGESETAALKKLAAGMDATIQMLMLAFFNILLSKISGSEDIIVNTPISSRSHAELEKIIGVFLNTLPLRNLPTGHKSFPQFLKEVRETSFTAYENQDYPLEDLVKRLGIPRDLSRNPLSDVMFEMHMPGAGSKRVIIVDDENREREYGEMNAKLEAFLTDIRHRVSRMDIDWYGIEGENGLFFSVMYSTGLFKKERIEKLVNYYKDIVNQVLENNEIKLSDIKLSHDFLAAKPTLSSGQEDDFGF
ncbi:MAG: amino acid adenylation domain-containing protein [bacterium]|nr:amino acid adenylation domain-containing protein [bacterium]